MGKMIRQQICFCFFPTCRETQQDSSWRPAVTKEGFVPQPQLPPHGCFQKNQLALPRKTWYIYHYLPYAPPIHGTFYGENM